MVVGATGLAAWLSMIAALMAGWLVSPIAWAVTGGSFDPNLVSQLVGLGLLGAVVAGLWLSERVFVKLADAHPADAGALDDQRIIAAAAAVALAAGCQVAVYVTDQAGADSAAQLRGEPKSRNA